MKVILDEIVAGWESSDMPVVVSPLVAPQGARPISKDKFKQRFEDFQIANDEEAAAATIRKWRTQNHGDVEHRAELWVVSR